MLLRVPFMAPDVSAYAQVPHRDISQASQPSGLLKCGPMTNGTSKVSSQSYDKDQTSCARTQDHV